MINYLRDSNHQVLRKLTVQFLDGELPDFVKHASIEEDVPPADSPLSIFADTSRRLMPLHTKSAAWISNLQYWGAKANGQAWDGTIPETVIQQRLTKAARIHGIILDVQRMKDLLERQSDGERPLKDSDFALSEKHGSKTVRRFPVTSKPAVEKSAAALHRDRGSYPYLWRKRAATAILHKAAQVNADIEEEVLSYLVKAAGLYPMSKEAAGSVLLIRAAAIDGRDEAEVLKKAAKAIADSAQDRDIVKLAELLDRVDYETGQSKFYASGMPMPEEILYTGPMQKEAAEEEIVELTTGTSYSLSDIEKAGSKPFSALNPAYLEDIVAFGGHLDAEKVAEVLPTMPRDDARLLEHALSAVGVSPVTKQAGAPSAPDPNDLVGFARQLNADGEFQNMNVAMAIPINHPQRAKKAEKGSLMEQASTLKIAGKDQPGVRDGTGPAKGSYQAKTKRKGKRQLAGEECPEDQKEVETRPLDTCPQ